MTELAQVVHLVEVGKLDNVLGVHEIDVDIAPGLAGKKIFNLVHNTLNVRVLCADWGDEILILDNGYMTSFLDNLALAAMILGGGLADGIGRPMPELVGALAKKFLAEQMLAIADSRMGRVLFLETVVEFDQHLRSMFALKTKLPELARSSDRFTAMAADFLRNHELGHVLSRAAPFLNYPERAHLEAQRIPGWSVLPTDSRTRIVKEITSDLFGINSVLVLYGDKMSGDRLKNYLRFLVVGLTRMHVLYDLAADSHRVNVDAGYDVGDIDDRMAEWQVREFAMVTYLDELKFGKDTVVPRPSDNYLPIEIDGSGILDVACMNYSEAPSENSRRIAELVSTGFAPDATFRTIVEGTRPTRVIDRR